jgi:hypothetical protein
MSTANDFKQNGSQFSGWHIQLREILGTAFDDNDIRTLCFDLNIDYDNLPGEGKTRKIIELINNNAHQGRIEQLIDYCSQKRPDFPWAEIRRAAVGNPSSVDTAPDKGRVPSAQNVPPTGPRSRKQTSGFSIAAIGCATFCCMAIGLFGVIWLIGNLPCLLNLPSCGQNQTATEPLAASHSVTKPVDSPPAVVPSMTFTQWTEKPNISLTPTRTTPPPAQPELTITTLDSAGDVGRYTSITRGGDGLGLIAYIDSSNHKLKAAHCSNTVCTKADIHVLDDAGEQYLAITRGADSLGLIAYRGIDGYLKAAHCHNVNCSAVTLSILDSSGGAANISIAVGYDGLGLISYRVYLGENTSHLKVAHCLNKECTGADTTDVDTDGIAGFYTSIAIGRDNMGLISYYNNTSGIYDLKVAHCTNTNCSTFELSVLDSIGVVGEYTSIAIGEDGLGLISYRDYTNHSLKVAHCKKTDCKEATTAKLDSSADVAWNTSIAIGTDNLGLISYFDNTNQDLKVAHCLNTACTSATYVTLDSAGDVGGFSSIMIGTDGFGLISYRDETNGDLKVAHCPNTLCSS